MGTFFIFSLAIFISGYTIKNAKKNFKDKNKLGGIAIVILSLMTMACPFLFIYVIK